MSKSVKTMMMDVTNSRLAGVSSACVVDISRLDAITTNQMRGSLKKNKIKMHVVKNSQARKVLKGGPLEPLGSVLEGPCALVYGESGITDIAKELLKWAKDHKVITLKKGIIEGDKDLSTVEEISKMKGKKELLGEVLMLVTSPARRLAGAIRSPGSKIAGCLKAKIDKEEPAAA